MPLRIRSRNIKTFFLTRELLLAAERLVVGAVTMGISHPVGSNKFDSTEVPSVDHENMNSTSTMSFYFRRV